MNILFLIGSIFVIERNGYPTTVFLVSFVLFVNLVGLWMYHAKITYRINYYKDMILINKRYVARITGEWTHFPDIGEEFIDTGHPYGSDLDVVGSKSLFQLLNVTNTWYGRQAFADDLLFSCYDEEEILLRQEAIHELSQNISFAQQFQHHSSHAGTDNKVSDLLAQVSSQGSFIKSTLLKKGLTWFPLFTVLCLGGVFLFQLHNLYVFACCLVLIQALTWAFGILKLYTYFGSISSLKYKLSSYSKTLTLLQDQRFSAQKLNSIQDKLSSSTLSAAKAISQLDKIIDKINVRHNFLVYFILNLFLLWDYECAFMLERWKDTYGESSLEWFNALGEFESLLSFSTLSVINDNTSLPTIHSTSIKAVAIGHPLIPNHARIYNDFVTENEIAIISGSNMSGKTTFLRTIGINLVLAQNGCAVCANQMTAPLLQIITSMRIADDLNQGVSTFYAELTRIKTILDTAKTSKHMIFLIDEIFRGTNSVDRLQGATTVLTKLNTLGVTGLITTHDLELCKLESYPRVKNFSFSEYYKDNQISFDYKIKQGKSTTTNAKYLMKMIGI